MNNQLIVRTCSICGIKINLGRLRAMGPDCTTCAKHSDARALTEADVEVDEPAREDMVRQCQTPERG
jgi:hypothetical protein